MDTSLLKTYFQQAFDIENWQDIMRFIAGNSNRLILHLEPKDKSNELSYAKSRQIFGNMVEIGRLKTSDNADLPIYDIELKDDKVQIEHNRVGVNELLKKIMFNNGLKGILVTFHYTRSKRTEWRFSFISKSGASDFFAELETKETNPKKYTYIFGTQEEHRTAIDRFYMLHQSNLSINDFFDAFNVEPVSTEFFSRYKQFHLNFIDSIIENSESYLIFTKERTDKGFFSDGIEITKETERDVHNFVKRLMGRLVFLYFLQKKHWLAATDKTYKDGDTNFLYNLFNGIYGAIDQNNYYRDWLCKVFFEALNEPNRTNDVFTLPNGKMYCFPYLNGGLFDESQEPEGHRNINIPAYLFKSLFDFFNSYNFTIYENSPEDHTIAVDPEMLGHIFENLLEDNKDNGTFYTPKNIVHYMCQESLIEYLHTHITNISRKQTEALIKDAVYSEIDNATLENIEKYIDKVKICDPAIGSGAFPMGLLQEIFNLKALIHYKLGYKVWSPATIKQNIIQNSIYGVDLEIGAVDIARLRFWLSLVVDEELPKPLPNLDYKIMQGNSLLENFEGISLADILDIKLPMVSQVELDFGADYEKDITLFDYATKEDIRTRLNKFFSPEQWQKEHNEKVDKQKVKNEINNIIEQKIHTKICFEKDKLNRSTRKFEQIYNIKTDADLSKLRKNSQDVKKYIANKTRLEKLNRTEEELISFQTKEERPYFLWHLFFYDVFENGGFDIVIGNPPYVDIKALDKNYVNLLFQLYDTTENRINLYSIFLEQGWSLLNKRGVLCYINPNSLLVNSSYTKIRLLLVNNIEKLIKLPDKVFKKAIVETMIILAKKEKKGELVLGAHYKNDEEIIFDKLKFQEFHLSEWKKEQKVRYNIFISLEINSIINLIDNNIHISPIINDFDFSLGITPYDKAKGHTINIIREKQFHAKYQINDNYVPLISGTNIVKYYISENIEEYLNYGNWLGAPRKPVFFTQPRVIVRQILSGNPPSIYAGYTNKELYHTQIGFSIIKKKNGRYEPKYLCAILNSSLINFYHKYKFTDPEKNIFQKILIENCKELPLFQLEENSKAYNYILQIVDIISHIKGTRDLINKHTTNNALSLMFEEVIDAMVYELYFEEHIHNLDLNVIELVGESLNRVALLDIDDQINQLFSDWNEYSSEIRNRIILQKTRSEYVITIEKALQNEQY